MEATPNRPDDARPDPMHGSPEHGGSGDFPGREAGAKRDAHAADGAREGSGAQDAAPGEADQVATLAAYAEYRRRFVEAGGSAPRFDALHLLEAARLQANRIWTVLARASGEADSPAPEQEVRKSLDGFAVEADVARSKGRMRAFARRLWPFGTPW